jgi:hypothetical protein
LIKKQNKKNYTLVPDKFIDLRLLQYFPNDSIALSVINGQLPTFNEVNCGQFLAIISMQVSSILTHRLRRTTFNCLQVLDIFNNESACINNRGVLLEFKSNLIKFLHTHIFSRPKPVSFEHSFNSNILVCSFINFKKNKNNNYLISN